MSKRLVLAAIAAAVLPSAGRADEPVEPTAPAPPASPAPDASDASDDTPPREERAPERGGDKLRDELRKEMQDELRRELGKAREELREEVALLEVSEDARNQDARQLKELKQVVNLLQLHGYWRMRGELFNRADLGRGADASGNTLFPVASGSELLGAGNMRLRLNPLLRVSDQVAVHGQLDVLDNVLTGSSPLLEPYFDATTGSQLLSTRVTGAPVQVKRLWAEVETPVGQLAFGRMGLHWGEGLLYNDGNCLDCDYGNTVDRLQLTAGPFYRHVVTAAVDMLSVGATSSEVSALSRFGNYPVPVNLQSSDDAWRYSLAVVRQTPAPEARRLLDDGGWVLNYGALFAYRSQSTTVPGMEQVSRSAADANVSTINGRLFELDLHAQLLTGKFRLATEWAGLQGGYDNIVGVSGQTAQLLGQPLDVLQGAGVVRGQWLALKQDALLLGVDLGIASGDGAPGQGARPGRPGSAVDGSAGKDDIDGRQFCTTGCSDRAVNNFRINPDFRIDQLLWRNLYTTITDAWFARGELRYRPSGRASGGGDDDGLELGGALVYSQALLDESTPGLGTPLGVELDASITYTARDRFFAALVGGFLLPLSGLNNPLLTGEAGTAKLGQVYRATLGVTF